MYIACGIKEVARPCLEAVRPEFAKEIKAGEVVVVGKDFGTGSIRVTAPLASKELGVALVIAKSFMQIFYRNAIDIVLPVIICPEAYDQTDDADITLVDLTTGEVTNENRHTKFRVDPIPATMMDILQAGGIVNYVVRSKSI